MARRNLLLCFDAFGTLFSPKAPVAAQYAEVARQCGITSFTDEQLQVKLMDAIMHERRVHPNYGKATGVGATQWWTNIIQSTFAPFIAGPLPPALVPRLLHRFSSNEGYSAEEDLVSTIRSLKNQNAFNDVVIGVVTNSDDRVPSILSSLGLDVSPLRFGSLTKVERNYDIDFHCMSYDVGVEKPDERIFTAADAMLSHIITSRGGAVDESQWYKVYVGDEISKDVKGAQNAKWSPILLDPEGKENDITKLEECPNQPVDELFQRHSVVRIRSLHGLSNWMVK